MNKKIVEIAEKTQSYITKNKNIPASITVNNIKYNYSALNYIFMNEILNNNSQLQNKTYYNAPSPTGTTLKTTISKTSYKKIFTEVMKFYKNNNRSPNYILVNNKKINPLVFVDVTSRIIIFVNKNKRLPNIVNLDTTILKKNTSNKIVSNDKVFNHFIKVFGAVTTIDEALLKIKGKGYGHYFNDLLTNIQVIDNLKGKGKQKPNCTDVCQMIWHIAKALGYEVRCVHVLCTGSGEGHVRLQLKHKTHTGGKWINRDGACVVSNNGKPITCIWCENGRLIDTNPKWFRDTLNK